MISLCIIIQLYPIFLALLVTSLQARGVTACYIAGDQHDENIKRGVKKGDYQLVIFTPEMILDSRKWRKVFLGDVYSAP